MLKKLFNSKSSVRVVENPAEVEKTSDGFEAVISKKGRQRHSSGGASKQTRDEITVQVTGQSGSNYPTGILVNRDKPETQEYSASQLKSNRPNQPEQYAVRQSFDRAEQCVANKSHDDKSKKLPPPWLRRNASLRQRSHSINIVQASNRSFSYDECEKPAFDGSLPVDDDKRMTSYNHGRSDRPGVRAPAKPSSPSSIHSVRPARSGSRARRYSSSNTSRLSVSSTASWAEDNVPRLVFIGDQHVGKTALINMFTRGSFPAQMQSVVSPVVKQTKFVYYSSIGKDVQVQFWDVDGGETELALECCLRAHAVVVVYDITNRSSFQKCQLFLESINPRISALLIANKLDLQESRRMTQSEGRLLAKIHRVQYIETSCRLNHNVEQALQLLLASIPKEYMRKRTPRIQARSYSENTVNVPKNGPCNVCHRQLLRHPHDKKEIEI